MNGRLILFIPNNWLYILLFQRIFSKFVLSWALQNMHQKNIKMRAILLLVFGWAVSPGTAAPNYRNLAGNGKECGLTNGDKGPKPSAYIMGGTAANIIDFPYAVSFQNNSNGDQHFCAGSLVSLNQRQIRGQCWVYLWATLGHSWGILGELLGFLRICWGNFVSFLGNCWGNLGTTLGELGDKVKGYFRVTQGNLRQAY